MVAFNPLQWIEARARAPGVFEPVENAIVDFVSNNSTITEATLQKPVFVALKQQIAQLPDDVRPRTINDWEVTVWVTLVAGHLARQVL